MNEIEQNGSIDTRLHWAIHKGNIPVVDQVLANGANLESIEDGVTPLLRAIEKQNFRMIRHLLNCGADPHSRSMMNGVTPLGLAAGYNFPQIVKLLLEYKAEVDYSTNLNTPLMIAAFWDSAECVRLLIEAGAQLEACDGDGMTPFLIAASKQSIRCLHLLEAHGANIDAINYGGHNAMDLARKSGLASVEAELERFQLKKTIAVKSEADSNVSVMGL